MRGTSHRFRLPGGQRRGFLAAVLALLVLGVLVASAPGGTAASSPGRPPSPPGKPGKSGKPLRPDPDAKKYKRKGLESRLAHVSAQGAAHGDAAAAAEGRKRGLRTQGDLVRVVVEASDAAGATAAVSADGGTVTAVAGHLVSAAMPASGLGRLAQDPSVGYVRPPFTARADAVTDEGVGTTNASAWQALGREGAGVKVAIVDLGFIGYTDGQAAGDLPASVTGVNFCSGGLTSFTEHGTAVAEIVHKMAPDAQLYLICVEDEVSLAQAEEYAKANGIRIVNHSVAWFDTSRGDGSGGPGTPDAIVADARANGILWVNAAGNYAQSHWSGVFTDANGNGLNEFSSGWDAEPIYLQNGEQTCLAVKWDSWPMTSQDFDLYLWDQDGNLVAASTNLQNGTQQPVEELCYTNPFADEWFYAGIYKFAATARPRFDLFALGGFLWFETPAGSVTEPASSPNTLAVGAVCWQNSALEPYSSRGPTIDNRIKPDIAGPDGTSSAVYGSSSGCPPGDSGFYGTSASSPHIAGAAALVEGLHPGWTPAQAQSFLVGAAGDLGPAGKDNSFGAGKLQLPVVAPKVTGFSPASGPVGTTVTVTGSALLGATTVRFNGTDPAPTSVTAASLKAVVPAGATSGQVQVVTPDGTGTSAAVFKVTPKVTGFSPGLGVRGANIEIDGSSFTGATKVAFGAVASLSFTVDNDNTIHAVVPPTAVTGKVTVTTPSGSGTSAANFIVTLPPTVTSFTPAAATVGTVVTVNGTSLDSVTSATLNGQNVGAITHVSAAQLKFTVPAGASTGAIAVTDAAGTGISVATFKVIPKVTGVSPGLGVRGANIEIDGTSFSGATKVAFGAVASLSFTVDDDSTIHAVVPPTAVTGRVTVTTPSGSGTSAGNFIVTLPPSVTSFTPAAATVGTVVTVNGTSLDSVTSATLNGQNIGTLTHVSAAQLKFTVPGGASSGKIAVTDAAGTGLSAAIFKVTPKVTGFSPALGVRGANIEIDGASFTGATKVAFGAVASLSFTVDDDSTIHAVVPPTATTNKITVTTPGGAGTSAANFIVTLAPTVTGFTPAAAPVGTVVSVNGTSLDSVTSATLNGQNVGAITHVSAAQLKFTVPAGASSGKIAVTDAAGTGTSAAVFKVIPKVTGFSPGLGVRGANIEIDGASFTGTTKVMFGAVASLSFTVDDDSTIHAAVPPTATTGKITVTTPGGSGTSVANFIVTLPPTAASFSPPGGPVGTVVTVNGTSLDSVTSATLNGNDVGALTHVSAAQLKFSVPAGASSGTIAVTDAAGTGTSVATFKVTPKITGYNPSGGAAAGAAVTINGTSLSGATVKFNGVAAAVEGGSDDTHINTHVPATATTGAVSVTTLGGTATGPSFKVLPTITSLTPDNGAVGTSVTISGTTFVGVSSVKFNGVAAAASTLNATTIKATVPAGATTGSVTVITPGGTATSPSPFSVGPKVASFSPTSGPTGATVTITGNGFHGTPTVIFNGLVSPSVTNVTPTSLKAVVPNGATTGKVQVTTAEGTGSSATNFSVTFSITGFTPSSGPTGTSVTVFGVGFLKVVGAKLGNLTLGGSIDSDTQVTVTIPVGASSGPIILANGSTSVTSPTDFSMTPPLSFFDEVVFVSRRDGNDQIYSERRDGELLARLTNNSSNDSSPVWSPDGTKIAFVSNRDGNLEIYVMNSDGTSQTRLTTTPSDDEIAPAWSADGNTIIYARRPVAGGLPYDIWTMDADGGNRAALTATPTVSESGPALSPDGLKVVFVRTVGGASSIWVMSSTGADAAKLTNSAANESSPAWSPAGGQIVFSRVDCAGGCGWSLYEVNPDGTAETRVTFGLDDVYASWAPCSRIVFDQDDAVWSMSGDGSDHERLPNTVAGDREPDCRHVS
jgi:hypothetical protein